MIKRAPIRHIPAMAVLKVAARCNLYCTYCHWFRDPTVEEKPALMSPSVQGALFARLHDYIMTYGLESFTLCLHGGEPLLFGRKKLREFASLTKQLQQSTQARISLSMTTNAALVTPEIASLLSELGIDVTVSMDGPKAIHDVVRVDRQGRGSYEAVCRGVALLREAGVSPTALAVADPDASGSALLDFFVEEQGFQVVDFLYPDFSRQEIDQVRSMSDFVLGLFERWYTHYSHRGVRVRLLESIIASLLGRRTGLQGVGFSPMSVLCVNSDGSLENHDALRISGEDHVRTGLNIMTDPIDALFTNPIWRAPYDASLTLPATCSRCDLRDICRGGDVIHRHDSDGYNHPSVYCNDYKRIYPHIARRIQEDLLVAVPTANQPPRGNSHG